jgi:putative membrane-bound dehydrogenase-like protein
MRFLDPFHCGWARVLSRLALCTIGIAVLRAGAQGYDPAVAAEKMTVPSGLEVRLIASEPTVRQPVAIEFDDRGRLWVVQYLQYPNPEGLERVEVDRYSRTKYDRIPDPPPNGPKGTDQVTILLDSDGDGIADGARDFVSGLNLASGLAFGYDGVFILQTPYLLFYPDRDHNDVPDSDPEVCLTGFGMEDAHSVANSLTWGPDGWLYGLQGSTVTARIRGIEFQQGIWRYHPKTKAFELFSEGGGNMWGLDFDPEGQLLASTNFGPYIMIHGVQGAYYWKSFGKHGDLHNPFTYGYFEHVTHHNAAGGHVAVGGIIYQGGTLPEAYHGKYIHANLLSHTVQWSDVNPLGATFETQLKGDFLNSNDTWFAPSDMTTGPDGAIYVCDWHDARMAHPDPDASWDRTNGRIYRIAATGTNTAPDFDLRTKSNAELVALLDSENTWYARRARVLLSARDTGDVAAALTSGISGNSNRKSALEHLWTAYATGHLDATALTALLDHPDYAFRLWAVRLLGDQIPVADATAQAIQTHAAKESDIRVKAQIASTAKRMEGPGAISTIAALLRSSQDTDDLFLPLLAWWAVEAHAETAAHEYPALTQTRGALTDTFLLPRLVRRLVAEGNPAWDDQCAALLAENHDAQQTRSLLEALQLGLADRAGGAGGNASSGLYDEYSETAADDDDVKKSIAPLSASLAGFVIARWEQAPDDPVLLVLATELAHEPARVHALRTMREAGAPEDLRVQLLGSAARVVGNAIVPELLAIATTDDTVPVRQAALNALRRFDDPALGASLAHAYPYMPAALQTAAREVLLSRAAWTREFLNLVDTGLVAPDTVPVTELRRVAQHEDPTLDELVKKHWGNVRGGTPEALLAEMRRLNNDVRAKPGDPAAGKAVFTATCAQCHAIFGEGHAVGPDLTQSNRMDTDYLLVSLVNPNLVVRKEYMQFLVETKDGGYYNGIVAERSPGNITLLNANETKTEIATGDIEEIREAGLSLMPEGILSALTPDDVRNLFSYLQSEAPAK